MSPLPDKAELEAAAAIVYRSVAPTPQYAWPLLAQRLGTEVWVKHENHRVPRTRLLEEGVELCKR